MDHSRRRRIERLAIVQAGVVSRPQAYAAGLTRAEVRANLRARRWQAIGSQSLVLFTGELPQAAREWSAVFEAGPRAFLDGASSLVAAGLTKFDVSRIRVSVPRGARVRRGRGAGHPPDPAVAPGGPRPRHGRAAHPQ